MASSSLNSSPAPAPPSSHLRLRCGRRGFKGGDESVQARLTVGLNMGWIYTHCIWAFQCVHMIKIVGPERKAFRVHRPILWGLGYLHTNSQIWLQIFTFSRQFTIPFALAQIICETHISFIDNNMYACIIQHFENTLDFLWSCSYFQLGV